MNKIYFTIALMIFSVRYSMAQFYTQYFDGADTIFTQSVNVELDTSSSNVWQIGAPQKIIFDSAATAPNAIVTDTINSYPKNNVSHFTIKIPNDFVPWGVLALQWKQKIDMDASYDGGFMEFTTDHGLTWENVINNPFVYNFYGFQLSNLDTLASGEYAFSGTDSTWRDIWLCFDYSWMSQFPDTLLFRFTFVSDSIDNGKEGWLLDNFMAHLTYIHTIKPVPQDNYLSVYPNPANNVVHIETEKLQEFHIIEKMMLVDPLGRVVDKWTNIPTKYWFDTNKYQNGLYYLHVKTNLKSETIPLVISNQ